MIIKKGLELLRLAPIDRYQVIAALDDTYPVAYMCDRLVVGCARQDTSSSADAND